jgi:hypothetical protein
LDFSCGRIIEVNKMNVYNHNGAEYGTIEKESNGFVIFYPKKRWMSGYSAHQLELIAKEMRKIE